MHTSPPLSSVARLEVRVAIVVGLVGDVLSTADAINADLTLMPFGKLRSAGVSAVKARDGCGLSDVPLAVNLPKITKSASRSSAARNMVARLNFEEWGKP